MQEIFTLSEGRAKLVRHDALLYLGVRVRHEYEENGLESRATRHNGSK